MKGRKTETLKKKSSKKKKKDSKIEKKNKRKHQRRKLRKGKEGEKKKKGKKNKLKKDKLKRKIKKNRRKKKKGIKKGLGNEVNFVRQDSSCSNLTCLTALVGVLKIEKDLVRNFLAQEKRVGSKLALMQAKQSKQNKYVESGVFLERRLGSTKDHKTNGPLCKGVYNDTTGIKVTMIVEHVTFLFCRLAMLPTGWKTAMLLSTMPVPSMNRSMKHKKPSCRTAV